MSQDMDAETMAARQAFAASASGATLIARMHDAVHRRRRAAPGDTGAAARATSLRVFHALKQYEEDVRGEVESAGLRDLAGNANALYEAGFLTRIWALSHELMIDVPRLPSTAWLDFYRGVKHQEDAPEERAVHDLCQRCLSELPAVPRSMLYDSAGDLLDPVSALSMTVQMCGVAGADEATQSQILAIARMWCDYVTTPETAESLRAYIVSLGRLSRSATLGNLLKLTHFFAVVGEVFPAAHPGAMLIERLGEVMQCHADIMLGMRAGDPDASQRFAVWRANVVGLYTDVYRAAETGESWRGEIQKAADGAVKPLFEGVMHLLEFVYVEGMLEKDSEWKEYLSVTLAYLHPQISIDDFIQLMHGEQSVFHRLGMTADDCAALSPEDRLTILLLRGDVIDVIIHLKEVSVPGVACHMLEAIRDLPTAAGFRSSIESFHAEYMADYANILTAAAPQEWRKALDYALWSGPAHGAAVFCSIVKELDVNSAGVDHVLGVYAAWRPHDADGGVRRALLSFVAAHGARQIERGLVVDGMRRLLEAEDLDAVGNHLEQLLTAWATEVLAAPTDLSGLQWIECDLTTMASAPVLCLAEAFNTQMFEWPSADAGHQQAPVYLSKQPVSLWDELALTPLIAKLSAAYAIRRGEEIGKAAVPLLTAHAAPTLLKFAVLRLLMPLLLDQRGCYFPKDTVSVFARTLSAALQEASIFPEIHEGIAKTDVGAMQAAIVAAHAKAVCFGFSQSVAQDAAMQ